MADVGSGITKICWAVAGGLAAWTAARVTGADRVRRTENPAVPLVSFTPQVALAAPGVALGLRLLGQRGPAAVAAVAAAALGLMVGARGVPRRQPAAHGPKLRVLTQNLYHGQADAEAVTALVRQLRADVLFLQELTADEVRRLKQAGLDDLMPHTQIELREGSRGSGIYSRFPLNEGPDIAPIPMAQPTALLEMPSGEVAELVCVHPFPPTLAQGHVARWREQLAVLTPPGPRPRILAGDFNATPDHAAFRAILRLGYADAAVQAGCALTPTWGRPGKRLVLTLDHILVDPGSAVLAYSVHTVPGSDHRAVYAEIRLR